MRDAGYTLTDTLASLAILGLAIGALAPGLVILAKTQIAIEQKTQRSQAIKRGEAELDQLLGGGGPYSDRLGGLVGDPDRLAFPCGSGRCAARLDTEATGAILVLERPQGEIRVTLPGVAEPRFDYVGTLTEAAVWPIGDGRPQRLRAINVLGPASTEVILQSRLWREHGANCEFDVISQDCRG